MTMREIYEEAIKGDYYSLILLIEFLVKEKKVLKWDDSGEGLTYYLQDRFHKAMKGYLAEYEAKREGER